jgi:hypothetical protein
MCQQHTASCSMLDVTRALRRHSMHDDRRTLCGACVCVCCRISKQKWPQEREVQWLSSIPEGNPELMPAVQAEKEVVTRWLNAIDKQEWKEYVVCCMLFRAKLYFVLP